MYNGFAEGKGFTEQRGGFMRETNGKVKIAINGEISFGAKLSSQAADGYSEIYGQKRSAGGNDLSAALHRNRC